MALIAVKFLHSHGGYTAGEIAGFPEAVAMRLVKSKVAALHVPKSESDKPKSAQATTAPQRTKIETTDPAAKSSYVTK